MPGSYLRRLRVTDQFSAVGCGVVMKDPWEVKNGATLESASLRIGVIKYFTVKWRRYYVQFIDASAPDLEALRPQKLPSLRDAKELAESLAISLVHGDVQLSRSATDRHWVDPEELEIYVLSDMKVWERPDELHQRHQTAASQFSGEECKSWYACSICGYRVPEGSIQWAATKDESRGGSPSSPTGMDRKLSPKSCCPTPEAEDDRQKALQRFHSALGAAAATAATSEEEEKDTVMRGATDKGSRADELKLVPVDERMKAESEDQYQKEGKRSVAPLQCSNCRNVFHGDCLLTHEKLMPPDGMDEQLQFRNLDTYMQGVATAVPELLPKGCHELHAFSRPKLERPRAELSYRSTESGNFLCPDCRLCQYCSEPLGTYPTNWDKLPLVKLFGCLELAVVCHGCNVSAHGTCCFPIVAPSLLPGTTWRCEDCRQCNSCGRRTYWDPAAQEPTSNGTNVWSITFDTCKACWAGFDANEYCPVCLRAWSTVWCDDMVQCDGCEFWVHAKCDNFTCKEQFTELTDKDVKYFCPICRDTASKSKYIRALDLLKALDKSHLFSEPVNSAFAPLYLRVVKKPMNLRKMRQKAEAHMYPSVQDFVDDFDQIITNAKLFNMPNTQTYKIAEQFEKNGRLVLERYLLKVAGAAGVAKIVNESPFSPTVQADALSVEGSERSTRTRRSTRITTKPKSDDPSPYKQRLKKARKGSSGMARLMSSPTVSPASLIITDGRILDLLSLIPLLSSSVPPSPIAYPCGALVAPNFVVPCTDISVFTSPRMVAHGKDSVLSPQDPLLVHGRWLLFECCAICGSFGDACNMVECSCCSDAVHYYCAGLISLPDKKSYHCPGCNRCPYCAQICTKSLSNDPTELAAPRMMCVKCGVIWHSKCRDRWVKKIPQTTSTGKRPGDWLWDDKFVMCDHCAPEQYKASFTASRRCLTCNTAIIEGTSSVNKRNCGAKISCLICGGKWHSKCIPEFRDLSSISVPDYVCSKCLACTPSFDKGGGRPADLSPTVASDTDLAKSLASELNGLRARQAASAERSRMLDALAGRHDSGLLGRLPKHLEPALQHTMALAGASTGSVSATSTAPIIGGDAEDWLVRTMGQDIFLPRRGTKAQGQASPTVSTPQDASIAHRLLAARDILQWIDSQDVTTTTSPGGGGDVSMLDSSPSSAASEGVEEPRALVQRSWWLQQAIGPAVLLLRIIHKTITSLDKGYIGAFSPARYPTLGAAVPNSCVSIPAWDERRCALCGSRSDTLSMGRLIPWVDGQWVHALCAQWTIKGLTVTFPGLLPTDFTAAPEEQPYKDPEPGATSAHALSQYARLSRYVSCRVDVVDYPTSLASSSKHTCPLCRSTGAFVSCLCGRHHYHLPCLFTADAGGPMVDPSLRVVYCGAIAACRAPPSSRTSQKRAPHASELVSQLHRCAVTLIPVLLPDQEQVFNEECAAIALGPPAHIQKVLPSLASTTCILATVGLLHPFRLPKFRMEDGLPASDNSAVRSGGLSILQLGTINTKNQIEYPHGFAAVRLFWSVEPTRRRSAYVCSINYDQHDNRLVSIRIATGGVVAFGDSVDSTWRQLVEQLSPERRQQSFRDFTAQWFFGLMSPVVVAHLREARKAFARRTIMQEASLWMDHPGARAQLLKGLLGPGNDSCEPVESIKLRNRWEQPVEPDMRELGVVHTEDRGISPLLKGHRSAHYKFLLDPSNCQLETISGTNQSGEYNQALKSARARTHWPEGSSSSPTLTALYRIRAQTDDNDVLDVKRSRIHNYGLFARVRFAKGDMVVEYTGEIVRHSVADCRERYYEEEMLMGQCCYMFRLDEHYVVDATLRGNTARFINHSCNPNCVCRVVEDPVALASEDDTSFRGVVRASHRKHIMIVAKNDIAAGEEITYDYQFAVESEKLACKCGAPNCLGRLN